MTGSLLVLTTVLVATAEWLGAGTASRAADVVVILLILLLTVQVRWTRQVFVLVGGALAVAAVVTRADWMPMTEAALYSAASIAAFFTALATLRNASAGSAPI